MASDKEQDRVDCADGAVERSHSGRILDWDGSIQTATVKEDRALVLFMMFAAALVLIGLCASIF